MLPAVYIFVTKASPKSVPPPKVDCNATAVGKLFDNVPPVTYALPADVVLPLIEALENGKLAPVAGNTTTKAATMPGGE